MRIQITCPARRCLLDLVIIFMFLLIQKNACGISKPGNYESIKKGQSSVMQKKKYNNVYTDEQIKYVAFPMGGIGAGMICLEGIGALSHFSIDNEPRMFGEPLIFAAICIKGDKNIARVIQGPVQKWKIFGTPGCGNGLGKKTYGFPGFAKAGFKARFPFGMVSLSDPEVPLKVEITGWSPFIPGDSDNSSLPVASLEYNFVNTSNKPVDAVFSFNSWNFLTPNPKAFKNTGETEVGKIENGFVLVRKPTEKEPMKHMAFAAFVDDADAKVNCVWFRGGWFDPITMAWKDIEEGACYDRPAVKEGIASPGGTVFVPLKLAPRAKKTIKLMLAWYIPETNLRSGPDIENNQSCGSNKSGCSKTHVPWYAGKFKSINELVDYWRDNYDGLRAESKKFSDCFYDTTLPDEAIEAIAANLTILKSPTVLRQKDGKLWCWEGCSDRVGCCPGSCTHVWNYAQALPHLFPDLERTLRYTEFFVSQDEQGHQTFRASLPIRPTTHEHHSASDGQLGGIIKVYRDWRISGDNDWLKQFWPKVRKSLDYCIETWDPEHKGVLVEPHHNTYDIEFWGPDGMCSSFYLGALKTAIEMGEAMKDNVSLYKSLFDKGRLYVNEQLFDGEYFYQKIQWKNLRAKSPLEADSLVKIIYSPEAVELLEEEGPKYQYGKGCLSDGVLGTWMAWSAGIDENILDPEKVASHVKSVHKYNLKKDLSTHANPQRPGYALGDEGGLLLCTWPKGGKLSLPFVYSNEVWTGIEYQVASHLISFGMIDEGLEIVRACRDRYDGSCRNPFNEYECGNWYARAMSSYALLQAFSGARFDAAEKVLYLKPQIKGDFKSFLCTETGYGTVGVKNGKPFLEVKKGSIPYKRIEYIAK